MIEDREQLAATGILRPRGSEISDSRGTSDTRARVHIKPSCVQLSISIFSTYVFSVKFFSSFFFEERRQLLSFPYFISFLPDL